MGEVHAIAGKDKGDSTVFQAREERRTLWVWLFLLPFLLLIGFNWWRNGSTCSFGAWGWDGGLGASPASQGAWQGGSGGKRRWPRANSVSACSCQPAACVSMFVSN